MHDFLKISRTLESSKEFFNKFNEDGENLFSKLKELNETETNMLGSLHYTALLDS